MLQLGFGVAVASSAEYLWEMVEIRGGTHLWFGVEALPCFEVVSACLTVSRYMEYHSSDLPKARYFICVSVRGILTGVDVLVVWTERRGGELSGNAWILKKTWENVASRRSKIWKPVKIWKLPGSEVGV